MKKVLIFVLSLLSALTFSLSSCSSSSVFKKIEFYGYGENETFYNELFEEYDNINLEIHCIFHDDYFIGNYYAIQEVRQSDLDGYKSVHEYLQENKKLESDETPSNRQITFSSNYLNSDPLRYIAIYDTSVTWGFNQKEDLIEVIKFSISDVIYKQYEK